MTTSTNQFFHISPTSTARARLEEAEQYFLLGNLDEALAAAQQAWHEHPTEPDVFRVLAYLHMARGEYPPAEQAARVAVQYDGQSPASYATLAQVYLTFNVRQMADQTLAVARRQFPDDSALLVLTADMKFRLKRDAEGVSLAMRALEANPQDGYAQALLGTYYLRRKDYLRARELLAGAGAVYPQRWDYLRDLGITLVHQQLYTRAMEMLTRAWQLNPQDPLLLQYLCYALRFDEMPDAWYWRTSFFFFNQTGLGIFLTIIGYFAAVVGLTWGMIQLVSSASDSSSLLWITLFLLGGIALVFISQPGVAMRGRKGEKFERYLEKALEKANDRRQV